MRILFGSRRPPRLLTLFLAATLLPAAALAWLGWRLVEQDRDLERQRVRDLVERTANSVTAGLERELGAIERNLGSPVGALHDAPEVGSALSARLSRGGSVTLIAGSPLLYEPRAAPLSSEPPDSLWADAERLEYAGRDAPSALRAYRALAGSSDSNIRAGALMRLARVLKRLGRADEALEAYTAIAGLADATILGDPADLMARGARVDLLATLERRGALGEESALLDSDLRSRRWRLNRTTALSYLRALKPWRSAADEAALTERIELADAVTALWDDWQARPPVLPLGSGRRSIPTAKDDVLVVWRDVGNELLVFAASPAYLSHAWRHLWAGPSVAVALVAHDGRPIAGEVPPASRVNVVKPASDTRLPWTLRVAATSTPADIAATGAARQRIVLAALLLLVVLLPATGYLVVRAVNKELALARQQAAFVSAVSHEFRSPLTSLTHLTSLLRSDFQPTDERRRQYYDVLAHETDRLRRFVETLLDFGRIQAGATRYHLAPVDPESLVCGVVEEFRRHMAAGSHETSLIARAPVPRIAADADALGRALWNLLENAAKYSPDESPIRVRLEAEGDGKVAIRVIDQGAGIPAAEQPFIFDQFFRGAAASQSAVRGTGVGLAVVRHIVSGHGGAVKVDSASGSGTTFSILVPAVPRESISAPERRVS